MATETKWGHGKSGTRRHIVGMSRLGSRSRWGLNELIPTALCSGLDIESTSIDKPTTMRMGPCRRCLRKAGLMAEKAGGA